MGHREGPCCRNLADKTVLKRRAIRNKQDHVLPLKVMSSDRDDLVGETVESHDERSDPQSVEVLY